MWPPVRFSKRATWKGCDDESGTPGSGEKRYICRPGRSREVSITIVALRSGTVTVCGRS